MVDEMPVNPEQAAEIDKKVEQVRKSMTTVTLACLAHLDPSIREKFDANRETILNLVFRVVTVKTT